jgi:phosphopantothenoylcysteine decarboxylase/phosphopantothenate--cysteine ligase
VKEKENKIRVLVTAGPTREYLDPVRYLTNGSSGEMGLEIARALKKSSVTVVAGPIQKTFPSSVKLVSVQSALHMSSAVRRLLPRTDVFIATAAVSDWRFANPSTRKLKKGSAKTLTVRLVANPDILAMAGASKKRPLLVGFALETSGVERAMKEKLKKKNLDLIIGNSPASFGSPKIKAYWLEKGRSMKSLGVLKKKELAQRLARWIKTRVPS